MDVALSYALTLIALIRIVEQLGESETNKNHMNIFDKQSIITISNSLHHQ